jgi:hypothetical protein
MIEILKQAINIYANLIIIEILDEIYARAQNWSSVEYT